MREVPQQLIFPPCGPFVSMCVKTGGHICSQQQSFMPTCEEPKAGVIVEGGKPV